MELRLTLLLNSLLVICHFVASSGNSGSEPVEENATKGGKTWAVLIAGTNGWSYYRHQANVCHAYKTLVDKFKMPKDRIITMMYDDIANDQRNPRPGELINTPNGTNVYEGVEKHYTGENVNLENLYRILKGEKKGNGKVIEPNAQNRIFIYFTGTGKGGFSRLISETIWADSFTKTLLDLKKNKKMKEALVYWESSHSGAMFENYLPYSGGVLAMTSAAVDEDSFGWYCNVDGMPVCLAGHFSISWISDAEKKSAPKQSIFEHYNGVRQSVTSSHPNLYGSWRTGSKKLSYFFGGDKMEEPYRSDDASLDRDSEEEVYEVSAAEETAREVKTKGLAEIDIPIAMLEGQISSAKSAEEKALRVEELTYLRKNRATMDQTMDAILEQSVGGSPVDLKTSFAEHRRCFKKLAVQFQKLCFDSSNYYVDHILPKLFTVCKARAEEEAIKAMSKICTEQHRSLKNVV